MKKELALVICALLLIPAGVLGLTTTIRPNGNATYSAWASAGGCGTNDWRCVDDTTVNTTDYLYASADSIKDTFAFEDVALSGVTINSLTLYYYGKRYSASRYIINPLIRLGGVDYGYSSMVTNSTYATYSTVYTLDPSTATAWTIAKINALEAGMDTGSSTVGGAYVAQVYGVVDYRINNACSDTDGGNVITLFGTVSGYYNQTPYNYSDYCVNTSNIMEYYCSANLSQNQQQSCGTNGYTGSNYCYNNDVYRNYTVYGCASGACSSSATPTLQQDCVDGQYCSSGACYWNNTCSDTDGGFVVLTQGTASGNYNGASYSNTDYCVNTSVLMENYCSGGRAYSYGYLCANMTTQCDNGACV